MQRIACGAVAGAVLIFSTAALAQTPSWSPPPESQRCPSKWGAGDERGAGNHMKPQTVLNAAKLIKTGEVIELGHVLSGNIPFSGPRRFDVHVKRTFMNPQSNNRGSNEETVISEIGQVGTQFDGFAHQTHGNSHYNCFKTDEIATRTGFSKLGVHLLENLKLDEMAGKQVYEFAFIIQPLKIQGGTGSTVAPIAVR